MSDHETSVTTERTNPFPGLRPFEPEEAHLFFGREGQSDELLCRLQKTRFLAVVGTSGSGKSSLIRAGLLPALHAGYMVEEGSTWRIALMRPGHDPIGNLAQQLQDAQQLVGEDAPDQAKPPSEEQAIKQAILEATLRRSARGLIEAAQHTQLGPQENLMVVVDQFEELFRFQKDMKGGKEEAVAFVKILLEAAAQRGVPIFIVLTMRSDFLGDCAQFRDLPEAFNAGQYLIPRMTRDQRRMSITGPVAVAEGAIAPRLVQTLLNTVGDDQDQLPILQHALMRSWDHWETTQKNGTPIDLKDYWKVGELSHALSHHADEAYNRLPTERAKTIAEKIFKCLTEKAQDNRETRRPTKLETLRKVARATTEEVIEVIDQFRSEDCTFLMPPRPTVLTDDKLIDISHESLIRKWTRLQTWVEEEADARDMYIRLVDAAQRHEKQKGNLWRDPELALALIWQETQKPNSTWASLYQEGFESAVNFLEKSKADKVAETRKRHLVMGLFGLLVLAVIGILLWANESQRQSVIEIEAALDEAEAAKDKAEQAFTALEEANQKQVALRQEAEFERDRARDLAMSEKEARNREKRQTEIAKLEEKKALMGNRKAKASSLLSLAASQDPTTRILLLSELKDFPEPERGRNLISRILENPITRSILRVPNYKILHAEFDPLGEHILTLSSDKVARLWRVDGTGEPIVFRISSGGIKLTRYAPDGKRIIAGGFNGTINIWSLAGKNEPMVFSAGSGSVEDIQFSGDGKQFITATSKGSIKIYDLDEGRIFAEVASGITQLESASLSPSGKEVLAISERTRVLKVWKVNEDKKFKLVWTDNNVLISPWAFFMEDGTEDSFILYGKYNLNLVRISKHNSQIKEDEIYGSNDMLSITPVPGMYPPMKFLTGNANGVIRFWAGQSSYAYGQKFLHNSSVQTIRVDRTGKKLVAGFEDGTAIIQGIVQSGSDYGEGVGNPLRLKGHQYAVTGAQFNFDGSKVLTVSKDGTARVWEILSTGISDVWMGHQEEVTSLVVSPNEDKIFTASKDGKVHRWFLENRKQSKSLKIHDGSINSMVLSSNGEKILTSSSDGTAKLGTFKDPQSWITLKGHKENITQARFSQDGNHIATASWDKTMRLWSKSGKHLKTFRGHRGPIYDLAFSPKGGQIVTVSLDNTGRLWSVDNDKSSFILEGHEEGVKSVVFSKSGNWLATTSWDRTVRVWDVLTKKTIKVLEGHSGTVNMAVFTSDDKKVITGSDDGHAYIWSLDKNSSHVKLIGHKGPVNFVALSSNEKNVLTTSDDGEIRIWDIETGGQVMVLKGHEGPVNMGKFAQNDSILITISDDKTLRIWPFTWESLVKRLRDRTNVCLTVDQRKTLLDEPQDDAIQSFEACERRYGRLK